MCERCLDEIDERFHCRDCNVKTDEIGEYYMVHDAIWNQVWTDQLGGMLCIGCLENRLGRQLMREDFTSAPINQPGFWKHSDRLIDRLGYKEILACF